MLFGMVAIPERGSGNPHYSRSGDTALLPRSSTAAVRNWLRELVAEAELHGEILFAVFEGGEVAVLADDGAMAAAQDQMGGGDECGGDEDVRGGLFSIDGFGGDGEDGYYGKERVVLEDGEGEVGLIAGGLAGEGYGGDFEKEDVGEEETDAARRR